MTLIVAAIGTGRRGRADTSAVADCEDQARAVAMADVDEDRARDLVAADAPHATPYAGTAAMPRETKPEVVLVTRPPPLHREHVLLAFDVGAHVVLEKPIALTVEDAEAIGEAAAKADRLIHVCHLIRYAPGAADLREILLGQPIALTLIWNDR